MVNLTISTLGDYLTYYAIWVANITSMISQGNNYGANEMASISVSYVNMANYSKPPRSKSETVIKFKRPKYEQKY